MPQYAVIASHPPDNCPLTNKAVREHFRQAWGQIPTIAAQHSVKVLTAIHLDPNHKGFILFEAPNAEAVRDFLVQAGFLHFLEIDFHLVTPLDALVQQMDNLPTIF
jgi:hypothetical protein